MKIMWTQQIMYEFNECTKCKLAKQIHCLCIKHISLICYTCETGNENKKKWNEKQRHAT